MDYVTLRTHAVIAQGEGSKQSTFVWVIGPISVCVPVVVAMLLKM